MRFFVACLCLSLMLTGLVSAQGSMTLPAGFLTADGNGASSFPFNNTADHKWQWHYANSNFAAAGVTGTITITDISVRMSTATAAAAGWDFPSVDVYMGSATTGYQLGQHSTTFADNTCADLTLMRSGPWTGSQPAAAAGAAAGDWFSLGVTNTFSYNPDFGKDIIVQIEKCGTNATWGASIDGASGGAGTNGGNRYGSTSDCAATTSTFANNEFVPLVKIDFIAGGTPGICVSEFQSNQVESSLTVDTLSVSAAQNGNPIVVDLSSSNAGAQWDIGLMYNASPVGASAGGLVTPGGQSVNLDLTNPTFSFLNNNFAGTPFTSINFPFVNSNLQVSGQMGVISASYPLGFALSQACEAVWVGCQGSGFEAGNPPGWANPGPSWGLPTLAWTLNSGGTPSGATGPTAANTGTNYIYCETSGGGGNGASEFTLDTCVFDVSSLTNFQLDFALSRIGATMGTLDVYMFTDAGGWGGTPVMSFTGADPTQTQGGVEWSNESYAITALPLGTTGVAFSFTYVGGGSFTGDIALDDISVN